MSAATATNALEIRGLSAGYGRYDVLRDVSLHVAPGEAVAVLGPNGAGKTTVLRSIMGMVKHRRGEISVDGVDVSRLPAHRVARGHAALVPEGRRLFVDQPIEDNLLLGALHLRRERERVQALLESVYALFPVLREARRRPAGALSGGQQQMVAIGRMLMSDPRLLLLDEPSLGLAPLAINEVADALEELRRQGRSILVVEQRVDLALRICDRLYVLASGEIVLEELASTVGGDDRSLIDAYLG
ncbi:MAG TPA: ABC transporter ATP-binding protein [Solirubrobacteraceae bacterium]|jgi:branched-chain amino acid transport system ATP-binding protein|nr:ABC transporter ATP-binding protein [Solirubrobacteraceae bacterium]